MLLAGAGGVGGREGGKDEERAKIFSGT